jgi:hypothetical protein
VSAERFDGDNQECGRRPNRPTVNRLRSGARAALRQSQACQRRRFPAA